jgi:predicted protein tyrosine phosphatase
MEEDSKVVDNPLEDEQLMWAEVVQLVGDLRGRR